MRPFLPLLLRRSRWERPHPYLPSQPGISLFKIPPPSSQARKRFCFALAHKFSCDVSRFPVKGTLLVLHAEGECLGAATAAGVSGERFLERPFCCLWSLTFFSVAALFARPASCSSLCEWAFFVSDCRFLESRNILAYSESGTFLFCEAGVGEIWSFGGFAVESTKEKRNDCRTRFRQFALETTDVQAARYLFPLLFGIPTRTAVERRFYLPFRTSPVSFPNPNFCE